MDKEIGASILGTDESETLLGVEPLHGSCIMGSECVSTTLMLMGDMRVNLRARRSRKSAVIALRKCRSSDSYPEHTSGTGREGQP